ncbi:MAG: hypothetical protein H6560_25845 [Lewinellaceae bacterium]|nr:hypothetical protein [Lewinellaceae bacterium]
MKGQKVDFSKVSDLQMQIPEPENTDGAVAMEPFIEAMAQEWQSEIIFLRIKFGLLIRLVKRSSYADPFLSAENRALEKELLRLVDQDFQMILKMAMELLKKWHVNNLLDRTFSVACFNEFRMIHQRWREMRCKQRQLEIQILEELLKNYPTKIF